MMSTPASMPLPTPSLDLLTAGSMRNVAAAAEADQNMTSGIDLPLHNEAGMSSQSPSSRAIPPLPSLPLPPPQMPPQLFPFLSSPSLSTSMASFSPYYPYFRSPPPPPPLASSLFPGAVAAAAAAAFTPGAAFSPGGAFSLGAPFPTAAAAFPSGAASILESYQTYREILASIEREKERQQKPPYSYIALIAMAIRSVPDQKITLSGQRPMLSDTDHIFG